MYKRSLWLILGIVAASVFAFYATNPIGSIGASSTYGEAAGQLARAESAQTTQEVIKYVAAAKEQLPVKGSASSWWSSETIDFEGMQAELDDIIRRANNISAFDSEDDLFVSEMSSMHVQLKEMQEKLVKL